MSRAAIPRFVKDAAGTALIEFALCLPLLLLLILGIIDFSFLLQKQQVLTNAAREGARMSVLPGYDYSDDLVKARVRQYVASAGVSETATPVVTSSNLDVDGVKIFTKKVSVTLVHQFSYFGAIAGMFGGNWNQVTLSAASQMRAEVPAVP